MLGSCGAAELPGSPGAVEGSAVPLSEGSWSDAWALGGGVTIEDVEVTPATVRPGDALTIAFSLRGPPLDLSVHLWPPAVVGRQVARGGERAPDPRRPEDSRVRAVELHEARGRVRTTLVLPEPWHATTAVVTVSHRPQRGAPRVAITEGPHTHDQLAVLAVVDVEPTPTRVAAPRVDAHGWVPDGRLDETLWDRLPPTPMVLVPSGEPVPARYASEVRIGWTSEALLLGARLRDRDVWATMTQHDDALWDEEVFEIFVFGSAEPKHYVELQVSPRGVVFDARFARYRQGDVAWKSAWTPFVSVDGTLDEPRDRDGGWSIEAAIPWDEICTQTDASCPPHPGMQLRLNTFRFERPRPGAVTALALSPPRVPDFHAPANAAIVELQP